MKLNSKKIVDTAKNLIIALFFISVLAPAAVVAMYVGEYGFSFSAENLAKILN
ncbi:hypothetical protein [Providencia stuartii]|uniref:hypothetical protein n=1 Tax=Providencia stuartii TaxID=588 RepID=UPI000AED4FC3|nr:hypothetical protein [Providencia stuartii]MDT1066011.1 hypothetical protein [Providencia stuartii]